MRQTTLVEARPAKVGQSRRRLEISDVTFKWILLLPAVLAVIALLIFPFLFTLGVSFTDWHLFNRGAPINFVGFKMWASVLSSKYIHTTTLNTLGFVATAVPIEFGLGLLVALALNEATRGRSFFRVFFLMPLMISPIAVVFIIGRLMLHEDIGAVNAILMKLGFERVMWLSDPMTARFTIILVDVWQSTAFMILMFLAALQSLPQEPYEAAIVDGSTALQRFRYITLPLLGPVALTATLIRGLDAFKVIDIIYALTGGGPGQATESVTLTVYRTGVKGGDIAFGSAAAYLLLILMALFAFLLMLAMRRWVRRTTD
ncbi:MAG: sugar ABC transporter permease [Chloroflexi bacterium]|nr:sugar ABC transporter permease [Chloroflexota bacterium]